MKKRLLKCASLVLAMLIAVSFNLPAFATPPLFPDPPTDADVEKLTAFFQQETATEGVLNGDACYIVEIPENASTSFGGSYNGGAYTPLVEDYYDHGANGMAKKFMLSFGIWVGGMDYDPATGQTICWDTWDWPVCPDLYGPLELDGTSISRLENRHRNSTHITALILDGCESLISADVGNQPFCTEFSALDCPVLTRIMGENTAFESVSVRPAAFTEPLYARVFGCGTICSVDYTEGEALTLQAADLEGFVGWFENGVCVSESVEFTATDGASVTACFGGDANGDGGISVADAVLALRAALLGDVCDLVVMDVNGSGSVDISDAVMILRFALSL